MNFSYVKLHAKKKLINNYFKSFIMSVLPYVSIILLSLLNYYLYIFLKATDFTISTYISSYAVYVKATLLALSVLASFVLWKITSLISDRYFFTKVTKVRCRLSVKQIMSAIMVSVLKVFLSLAWGGFYFSPCAVVLSALIYSINSGEYTFNVMLTLFVSTVILFVIGLSFFYVTLKRYSACNLVLFTQKEKDSIKILANSVKIIENNTVRYSLYKISFIGWIAACLLIVPLFYVLPYVKMAKYSYFKAITQPYSYKTESTKPIVFYINKKEKA